MANDGKNPKNPTRRDVLRWMAAGVATSGLTLVYGDVCTEAISVERRTLRLPRWEADGFRVAVISDLHLRWGHSLERALLAARLAMAEKPDAILMPGDFLDRVDKTRRRYLKSFVRSFDDAPCPVLATMGNHDYKNENPGGILRNFRASKVQLLRNEAVEVDGVTVAGVDDALTGFHRPQFLEPGRHAKSLLAMLHEPDYVRDMPRHVSLQVSGHSHGGQICLPFGLSVHTPRGAREYIDGFYPNARVPLFVSRGIGTTGPDLRLFCRPQVAVLTLRSA